MGWFLVAVVSVMTSPAAAFAGLLNSGKGLAVGVEPLLVTAEEDDEEEVAGLCRISSGGGPSILDKLRW